MEEVLFGESQFFLIFMFALWVYISLIGYENNDSNLLWIQFFVLIPLVLYVGSLAFFDGLTVGYGVIVALLTTSVYFVFLGTALAFRKDKMK